MICTKTCLFHCMNWGKWVKKIPFFLYPPPLIAILCHYSMYPFSCQSQEIALRICKSLSFYFKQRENAFIPTPFTPMKHNARGKWHFFFYPDKQICLLDLLSHKNTKWTFNIFVSNAISCSIENKISTIYWQACIITMRKYHRWRQDRKHIE